MGHNILYDIHPCTAAGGVRDLISLIHEFISERRMIASASLDEKNDQRIAVSQDLIPYPFDN
jgi:hypothetical protein